MWTPKRVVMLSGCFIVLFTVYLGYAYTSVGRIDGLPPLPEAYWPTERVGDLVVLPVKSKLVGMIKQAFGDDCPELKRPIRVALPARNMVLTAEQFQVTPDGRVCLNPISVALFGKDKGDRRPVEISCIRADVAWLKFDRPVANLSDLGSRKIVEAELNGQIDITNNRRRKERDEDLHIHFPTGPLYYRESTHRIWTHSSIVLTDHKSKPDPNVIKGKGMELELAMETPTGRPAQRKQQKENISGVKWIVIQSGVDMTFYTDGKSGFLATTDPKSERPSQPAPAAGAQKPERAVLSITTPGKFRYDIFKDHDEARFDAMEVPANKTSRMPPQVHCDRHNLQTNKHDQLDCRHLTLRLRRKDNAEGNSAKQQAPSMSAGAASGEGADIETAHAISHGKGRHVVLTSDEHELTAYGNDFFYDARTQTTTLKGCPELEVHGKDTTIFATELVIQEVKPVVRAPAAGTKTAKPQAPAPAAKGYQKIWARGPGRIFMVNKAEKRTMKAYWTKMLTSDRDGNQDLLTLTGDASFVDEQAQQTLKADVLKVWLDEADGKADPAGGVSGSRKPRHVEAIGNVVARSREMNIHDSSRLVVWFKDVPAQMHLPPAPVPIDRRPAASTTPTSPRPAEAVPPRTPQAMPRGPAQATTTAASGGAPPRQPAAGPVLADQDKPPPERPFDLTARNVEVHVLRSPIKNTVDELWCEGRVHVIQDPARAEEKGTEVKGDTLKMTAEGDGAYFLVVTGDLAELLTGKIFITGPEVNIDQSKNLAWVYGEGAMKMESDTNFEGKSLEKPVPLTVLWAKSMLFNGDSAEFVGSIQADQDRARLACQHLHVYFDRTVSLKQGNRGDQQPRVRKMVCDQEVRVEDSTYDEHKKLIKYTSLEAPVLHMDALEPDDDQPLPPGKSAGNKVIASGRGLLKTWEPGSNPDLMTSDSTSAKPQGATAPKDKGPNSKKPNDDMKLTCVWFKGRMDASSQTNTAYFWEKVQVLNLPADRHDKPIDLDAILIAELPERALYLSCDRLKVLDRPTDGKPNKQMEAHGSVYVQGKEFYARAASVYYNQAKEQVILEGGSGVAKLYRQLTQGGKADELTGKKIIYNRKTGHTKVENSYGTQGQTIPGR
jgi:lipopolysaccharide export system protein LptA